MTRLRIVAAPMAAVLIATSCGSTSAPTPIPVSSAHSTGSSTPAPASNAPASATTAAAAACPWTVPAAPAEPAAPRPNSKPGWWQDRVFYEAFVRSFSDSNGDGIGDLKGLTAKLDYLNDGNQATSSDLGITGLWLMPVMPSPSYHGYDVTDYRAVNPDYGSLDDLRALVTAAHKRGIAVILDMPFNHTSSQHPWFTDAQTPGSTHDDWYVWADSPQGANWFQNGSRYYYANFGADFPDLNLRNPDVTAEITGIARFWLGDVGVDGFRLDAAKHLIEDGPVTQNTPETHAWLHDFRLAVKAADAGALVLGEVFDTPAISSSYVPDSLDLSFDFGLAGVYVATAGSASGNALGRSLSKVTGLYAQGAFGSFLTNHDMNRVATQLGGDAAKLHLAAGLLLAGPGVPFVYYGEEVGMSGAKPDEQIRTPMRWDASGAAAGFTTGAAWEPLSGDPATVNVATESANPCSLLSWYRDLIHLRAAHQALSSPDYTTVTSTPDGLVAELRSTASETVLVVANTGGTAVMDAALSLAGGPLQPGTHADLLLGLGSPASPLVDASGGFSGYQPFATLPPYSVSVISLGP